MSLVPGARLGSYEILDKLGEGGMGEVYRARDLRLGRDVAIKILPKGSTADPERLARFEREARAVSVLNHPHIVTLYEVGSGEAGPYLVLENIEGRSLRDILRAGALPLKRVLTVGAQVAEGLAKAHAAGVVHRDLKPENVMVTDDGFAKILDFGLAKLVAPELDAAGTAEGPTLTNVTATEQILGTVGYLSPEQASGKPADYRADQFALGALLYEMAAGERPFRRDTVLESLTATIREEPEPLRAKRPDAPAPLEWLVTRCLAKDPDDRYASTRDLARDLSDLRDRLSDITRRPADLTIAPSPTSKFGLGLRALPWLIAMAALAIAGVLWRQASSAASVARRPMPHFSQLTDQAGQETDPAVSPDGTSIAYAARVHGTWDVFVQRVGGHNPLPVAADPARDERAPAFSPDGTQLAFHLSGAEGGIFVVGATGESARRLTDRGFHPAWSPDGRQIVFCAEEIINPAARFSKSALFVVDVKGGAPRKIFDGDAVQPVWSPSGRLIAFWGTSAAQRDLFTIPAEGGSATRVSDDDAIKWSPAWADDGRALLFASDRSGATNLWRVPIDPSTGRATGPSEPVTNAVLAAMEQPAVSKNGGRIVFRSRLASSNPVAVPFDPVAERFGEPKALFERNGLSTPGDVSPDGQWLVLQNQGEVQEDVFICRTDGSDVRRLTDDAFRDRAPTWAPDSKHLVFYSNRSGTIQIWTINIDGSGLTQVTDFSSWLYFPFYSPKGDRLAAVTLGVGVAAESGVFFLDLSQPQPIKTATAQPGFSVGTSRMYPRRWSPDGRRLVGPFGIDTQLIGIAVYDLATHVAKSISDKGRIASWLPDSRRVIMIGAAGELMLVDADTGRTRPLPLPPTMAIESSTPVVAPDGRTVYLGVRKIESDIWMIEYSR